MDKTRLMLAGNKPSRADSRVIAMLGAKMRDSGGTRDVRIGDISPTGMLVACERPPSRGEFVDIDVRGHHIIGQVRWVNGRRCGLRTRERINVNAILADKPPGKRNKGKKVDAEAQEDISKWSLHRLLIAYGVLTATAFSTAYLIVNYLIP